MAEYRKSFTFRTTEGMLRKIKYIADNSRRSMNAEIEVAIDEYIRQYEQQHGKIEIKEND